jgi:hypothetical protein
VAKRIDSRLWALAALQAAVTISWQAYAYFQPLLLARFGFTTLAGLLGWYLVFAGTTLAPLAGDASDRLVRSGGTRFPVIRAGVALAVASFVAVAVTARADAESPLRFVLPLFVAIWIAGMTLFQAPALAIVRDLESGRPLSTAMAPVVAATVLPAALWPWVEALLARTGGSMTFLAGGIAVAGTAAALGRSVPVVARDDAGDAGAGLPVAFGCGLLSAVAVVLGTDLVPARLAEASGFAYAIALVGVAAALMAFVLGGISRTAGAAALTVGAAATVACGALAPLCTGTPSAVVVSIGTGAGLGLHLATALPVALSARPAGRAGLVTGVYLAGAVVGNALVRFVAA